MEEDIARIRSFFENQLADLMAKEEAGEFEKNGEISQKDYKEASQLAQAYMQGALHGIDLAIAK